MNAKEFENHCKNLEGEGQHTVAAELRAYVAQRGDIAATMLAVALRNRLEVRHLRAELAQAKADAELDTQTTTKLLEVMGERDSLREALARVEAEAGRLAEAGLAAHVKATAAQTQLAEAVELLRYAMESSSFREIMTLERDIAAFLDRHAQEEKQEAQVDFRLIDLINEYRVKHGVSVPVAAKAYEAQGAQAGEFQREDRYIVIKRKDLGAVPLEVRESLGVALFQLSKHLPKRECLVIESDWPEYEPTWAAIQARVTGQGAQAGDERAVFCDAVREAAKEFLDTVDEEGLKRDAFGEFVHPEPKQLLRICQLYRAALATQPAEWADQLYTQGFDAGAAASKRLNAVRGAEQ